jgi:hypothetical protein
MFDKISLAMARSYTRAHTTSAENFRLTEIRLTLPPAVGDVGC